MTTDHATCRNLPAMESNDARPVSDPGQSASTPSEGDVTSESMENDPVREMECPRCGSTHMVALSEPPETGKIRCIICGFVGVRPSKDADTPKDSEEHPTNHTD